MGVSLVLIRIDKADFDRLMALNEQQLNEQVALLADFDIDKAWDAVHFVLTGKRAEVPHTSISRYDGTSIQDKLKGLFKFGKHEAAWTANGPRKIPSENASTIDHAIDAGFLIPHHLGVGLATYLDERTVAEVAAELGQLTDEELKGRFHPDTMSQLKIYPGDWTDKDLDEYVLPAFIDLRMFYTAAAQAGQYVIRYFT